MYAFRSLMPANAPYTSSLNKMVIVSSQRLSLLSEAPYFDKYLTTLIIIPIENCDPQGGP